MVQSVITFHEVSSILFFSSINILPFYSSRCFFCFAPMGLSSFLAKGFWQSQTALSSPCLVVCVFLFFLLSTSPQKIQHHHQLFEENKDFAISISIFFSVPVEHGHRPNVGNERRKWSERKKEGRAARSIQKQSNPRTAEVLEKASLIELESRSVEWKKGRRTREEKKRANSCLTTRYVTYR